MKKLLGIHDYESAHWVGDGFPVRTLFSYQTLAPQISPFLLLDYAGPAEFPPATQPRGVGSHPHRGFETVTIVYQGEVAHRDSAGHGGMIGPGDVQWMTAGAGVLHEELHSEAFTQRGGALEMAQLWVNLPARLKMTKPRYQTLLNKDIPQVPLDGAGSLRVIAGEYQGHKGPALTFTPMNLWDLHLVAGASATFDFANGHTAALAILRGKAGFAEGQTAGEAQLALFDRQGSEITFKAETEVTALLMSGEPFDEPIVGRGPFVMNTENEIRKAIYDFQTGQFGRDLS